MIEHRNEKSELHRVDGPAVVSADGFQAWWLNGKLHRADGPAVVYKNGDCEWWVDGELIKSEHGKEKE
jgi:hypothetical protein